MKIRRSFLSVPMFAILILSSAVAFGAAGAKPTISVNGITDTLNIHTGQPVR